MSKSILPIMCNVLYNHLVPRIIHVLTTTFTLLIISMLVVSQFFLHFVLIFISLEWNLVNYFKYKDTPKMINKMMVYQYWYVIWINRIPFQYIKRYILDLFTNVILVGADNTKADNT